MKLFSKKKKSIEKVTDQELEYASSLSAAVLQKSSKFPRVILYLVALSFAWMIAWGSYAEIDERVQAEGKIIPSSKVKRIQNLEGGIVQEILVSEGKRVKKGEVLLKIDNVQAKGSLGEKKAKYESLIAQSIRLKAESNGEKFDASKYKNKIPQKLIDEEYHLYKSDNSRLKSKINVLKDQLAQKNGNLREARGKIKYALENVKLIEEEVNMKRPLVAQGIESRPDFLKLKRELSEKRNEYSSTKLSIPRTKAEISEIKSKIAESKSEFQNKAREELNKIFNEISQIDQLKQTLEEQVGRTEVLSPVDGIVKKIDITTIGQVIKSGDDMMEIVPLDDALLIEAKVKPQDIAFLFPGQKAKVKFSAYDFSIYGGLEGKIVGIGADSIIEKTNKGEQSFFMVKVKTNKNFVEKNGRKGEIMPGMIATVDILTGKKTVLDYLLKPILKAKQNALRER
jgi:adhesin transport system membrane fusion protein